jgi:hypothetical protein
MPTIPITREVGLAIQKLNDGWALCQGYFFVGRGAPPRHGVWNMSPPQLDIRNGSAQVCQIEIHESTFEALKKAKLLQRYVGDYNWWRGWAGRKAWILSDAGKAIKLPPEELWLEDECPTS